MKLLMKIVKSSLNEIDILGTRQKTRAIMRAPIDTKKITIGRSDGKVYNERRL